MRVDEHMGNKRKLDEDLEGLTPQAIEEYRRYKDRLKSRVDEIKKIPLSILVWGPSLKSNSPLAVKRREIYKELRAQGHLAMYSEKIRIDEEDEEEEISQENEKQVQRYFSLELLEFIEATEVNLVILLVEREAIGSIGELHLFGTRPELITKIYAIVPTEFEGSFSSSSVIWIMDNGYGGVYWYKEADIHKSNVFTKVIARVQARREMKYKEKIQQRKPARARGAW